jgi:hypothetical protein
LYKLDKIELAKFEIKTKTCYTVDGEARCMEASGDQILAAKILRVAVCTAFVLQDLTE